MNNNSISSDSSFTDKVIFGLKKALRKLAEETAVKNGNLIIADKEGNVKSVPARELLKTLPK